MYASTILTTAFVAIVAIVAALPKEACYHPNGCQSQGGYGQGSNWLPGTSALGNWPQGSGQWQGSGNVPGSGQWQASGNGNGIIPGSGQWQGSGNIPGSGQWQGSGNVPGSGQWQQGGAIQQQLPLHFAGAGNQQVQLGQLTPCDYSTSSISFPADIEIEIEIDIKSITCQAFTDATGNSPIGSSFGYGSSCDFDSPTQIRSILCTVE